MIRAIGAPSPQTINNALTYTFTGWSDGGAQTHNITTPVSDATYTATFAASLRTADIPVNTVNGLGYSYYTGTWTTLPTFSLLNPAATGSVLNFDISPRTVNDNFGFSFIGYVNVPTDGIYTFYTSSDDGSKLYIGGTLVVNNDGVHGAVETSGQIGLRAGKHAIRVDFFENTGGEVLTVSYAGPGITKQVIPNSALYRVETSQTVTLTPVADAYVRSGNKYANSNFGTANVLATKQASNANQETYLRFNIASLGSAVSSARLRVYGSINNTSVASIPVEVHEVTNNTWGETTITYNNRPAAQAAVLATTTVSGTTAVYYEWNVTTLIANARAAGATTVTLLLRNATITANSRITFNSKEASTNKPQLVVIATAAGARGTVTPTSLATETGVLDASLVQVYPNPASTFLHVEIPAIATATTLRLLDLTGKVLVEQAVEGSARQIIATPDLAPGSYVLMIETPVGWLRKLVLIAR